MTLSVYVFRSNSNQAIRQRRLSRFLNVFLPLFILINSSPPGLAYELQVSMQGNNIIASVPGLSGETCCLSAIADEPISIASGCSVSCPVLKSVTLDCNWVGDHIVNACWKWRADLDEPFTQECGSKNITVTLEAPSSCTVVDVWVPPTVLTHKYGATDTYPFPSYQAADAQLMVRVKPRRIQPGSSIHLRVFDPPDPSEYAESESTWGDNLDEGAGLFGTEPTTTVTLPSDGSPIFVNLNVSTFAAGDNYSVIASPDPDIVTNESINADEVCLVDCAKSATITTQKRVYVETDQMFRNGAYLDAPVAAGATSIKVTSTAPFARNKYVALIGSPPIGTSGPHVSEVALVTKVDKKKSLLTVQGTCSEKLCHSYSGPVHFEGIEYAFLADAVGAIDDLSPADYFTLNKGAAYELFRKAFVEFKDLIALEDEVFDFPFEEILLTEASSPPELLLLTSKWFFNKNQPNVHHLIAAAKSEIPRFGLADTYSDSSTAVIFVRQLEELSYELGGSAWTANAELTAHELAHLWRVNPPDPPGHCGSRQRYLEDGKFCTMHSPYQDAACGGSASALCREFYDGTVMFHFDTSEDSEYFTIRKLIEPLPEN